MPKQLTELQRATRSPKLQPVLCHSIHFEASRFVGSHKQAQKRLASAFLLALLTQYFRPRRYHLQTHVHSHGNFERKRELCRVMQTHLLTMDTQTQTHTVGHSLLCCGSVCYKILNNPPIKANN